MRFYEYLQLTHQFLGQGRSVAEFVPKFFTDVMTSTAPTDANPFLDVTPGHIKRIYDGDRNLARRKASALQPHLSGERFQALIEAVFSGPDPQDNMIDAFKNSGEDINETNIGCALSDLLSRLLQNVVAGTDNPKLSTPPPQQPGKAVTIQGTPSRDISVVDGMLHVGHDSIELPKGVQVEPEIADYELKYATQLCLALSEGFGHTVTCETVSDDADCGEHFRDQRQHFYNAEAIRVMLEHFPDGSDEFSLVKNETYTGVQAAWMLTAKENGFTKMLSTLKQAGQLALTKSKVSELFGQSEIAGVCHILVNDDRIWWVKQP